MAEAVAVHPFNPDVIYVASGNGGVWRTENARNSLLDNADNDGDGSVDEPDEIPGWTPTMEQWPNLSMGAIAFDPLDGSSATLYAGNGRFSSFLTGGPRLGLMKTVNSGTTWTELGRSTFRNLNIEVIIPTKIQNGAQQTILVATNAGIYRSTDTGSTWARVSGASGSNLPNGATTALVGDPSDDNRFWTAIRGQGVYRSTDGGAKWTAVNSGLKALTGSLRIELAVHDNQVTGSHALYSAIVTKDKKVKGVFRSTNSGDSWTHVASSNEMDGRSDLLALVADREDPDVVYVSSVRGPYRVNASTNAWDSVRFPNKTQQHDDARFLTFDLQGNLLEASDGGVYRLRNPNNDPAVAEPMRWELFGGIRATEFTSVAYDWLNDIILGGTQDNASIQQPSPGNWQWKGIHGGDGGTAAVEVNPNNSYRYTTGNHWGDFRRTEYDANNNASPHKTLTLAWQNKSNGHLSGLTDPASRKPPGVAYFAYLTSPYLPSPTAPWPLAMNIGPHTYESLDRGDTISDVSPGGFAVYQYASNGTIDSLADADALLARSPATTINYSDTPGGSAGRFGGDAAFPGGNDDDFALQATATLNVAPGQEGLWTFGINSDDGSRLLIDGAQVIKDDSIHAAQDTFGTHYLSRGQHKLDLVFFDHLGGASIELFAASGVHSSFNLNFTLVTSATSPGLRVTSAGFSVQQLVSNQGVFDLDDADDLLSPRYLHELNLSDVEAGSEGRFGSDLVFPRGNDDDFVIRAEATLRVPQDQAGVWTFGVNSDDGSRLLIDGKKVIEDDSLHAADDRFGTYDLKAGSHQIELVFFDHASGAALELFAAKGSHSSFNSNFELITSRRSDDLQVYPSWGRSRLFSLGYGAQNAPRAIYVGSVDFHPKTAVPELWIRPTPASDFSLSRSYPGATPHDIAVDPNDWQHAYVLDRGGGPARIWWTTDGGATWTELSQDPDGTRFLPSQLRTIELVRIGGTPVLLVGGDGGVYRRINPAIGANSRSWTKFGHGFPNVVVEDVHYYPEAKVLVAGTLGRGAWKIYNADDYLPVSNTLTINGDQEFKPNTDEIRLVANQNILDTFGDPMWLHVFVNNTSQIPNYSVEFAALNGIVVNGLSGKDWIRIENVPASTSLTVNGGDDDDFITFELDDSARQMLGAGDPWINGGDGADWIAVKPSTITQIHVDGGNPSTPTTPADTLNVLTGGANLTDQQSGTPGQGLAWVTDFSPIPYFGIEDVIANGPFFPPDRLEENDSRTAATDLVAGSHTLIDLNIDHAGDDDWYKWTASNNGTLIVGTSFRNNWGNLNLELYNSAGGLLQSSTTLEDDEHIVWNAIDNQTYYIRVYGQGGASNPDYTLTISWPFGVEEDALEANDSFANAYDLGKGDQVRSDLTIHRDPGSEFISDDDWYEWTATGFGPLTVDLLFPHSLGDLNLELYDASETLLDSSTSMTDNERVTGSGVPGRKFYIRVYGFLGATHPRYELVINGADIPPDALGPHSSADQAFNLETGDVTITGLTIHQPGDEDWYRWTATEASTLNIDLGFSHAIGDLDMEVYDQDLELLSLADSTDDDEHIVLAAVAGQTFFIRVFGYLDATNHDYSLELNWPPPLPRDEFEPNESLPEAHYLGGGDQRYTGLTIHREPGDEFGSSDDWYRWDAWQDGPLVVTTSFSHLLGDVDLEILDARGEKLCESTSSTDSEVCEAFVFGGQTYFVHVYGFNGATHPAYDLTFDGPDLIADILEPNDTALEPFYLGMGRQVYADLTIHAVNNDDWYRWNPPENGVAHVAVFFAHELGDINLELYDRNGEFLIASASETDHEELEWDVQSGQAILIRVFGSNETTHRQYELLVEGPEISPDNLEPNDGLPEATDLGSADAMLEGLSINSPLDTDWYQWTAPGHGTLHVDVLFSHDVGDIDLKLHDASGNVLAESNSTTDNEHISWNVEGDTVYYLQAFGAPLSNILRRPLDRPEPDVFDAALQREYTFATLFEPGGIPGDFNLDGQVNEEDINLLCRELRSGFGNAEFDLNGDGRVDEADRDELVQVILGTNYGDSNLDGVFNSSDLIRVFVAGEYEDDTPGNSTWAEGDWNCDGDFGTADLILAFQAGAYSSAAIPREAHGLGQAGQPIAAVDSPDQRHIRDQIFAHMEDEHVWHDVRPGRKDRLGGL